MRYCDYIEYKERESEGFWEKEKEIMKKEREIFTKGVFFFHNYLYLLIVM